MADSAGNPGTLCRELVIDAGPAPDVHGVYDLELSTLTALTRLELCGYPDNGKHVSRDVPHKIGDMNPAAHCLKQFNRQSSLLCDYSLPRLLRHAKSS